MFADNFFGVSRFFIYLAVFSVILVSTQTLFPFIVVKYVFFRLAVGLALIAFLVGWLFLKSDGEKNFERELAHRLKTPLVIAVSVFVLMFVLSGFFGLSPTNSFWSNFERGEGGFQMVYFYLFFLLLVALFRDKKDWKKIFKLSLFAAGAMVLYGVLAGFGVTGFVGVPLEIGQRFQGSLGNTAYVGTYLLFAIFYTLYLMDGVAKKKKVLLALLILGFLVILWLTQTRGPFLGLGAGIFAFLLFLIFSSRGRARRWGIGIIIFLALLGGLLYELRYAPFMQRLALTRFFNITLSNLSTQSRFWSWEAALKGWGERPVFGWGPENFGRVFDKYFDTRHFVPHSDPPSDTWYDRAHNVFFDYLVTTGILGVSSYSAIFAVFFFLFFKRQAKIEETTTAKALIFAMPFAYLMQGFVIFDVLPIYLNLFLFLAFANFIYENR